jgi:signal transduction histidine kinase
MLTRTERFTEALDAADEFLARIGTRIEREPRVLPLVGTLVRVLWAMRGRSAEALVNAPLATDATQTAALAVRVAAARALVSVSPKVIPYDILVAIRHVLTYGASADGLFAWSGWAMLVAEGLKRPDLGAPFCEVALARAERMGAPTWVGVAWVYHSVLYQWKHPFAEVESALLRTRERSFELGEYWAGLAAGLLAAQVQFFRGALLSEVDLSLRHGLVLARQYRTTDGVESIQAFRRVVDTLRGLGEAADPAAGEGAPASLGTFTDQDRAVTELLLAMFLGDREGAWAAARDVPAFMETPLRGPGHFVWWGYRSVAILRAAERGLLTPAEARRLARPGRALIERWARPLPARRYRLIWIDATDRVLQGDRQAALRLYEEAIDVARSDGVRHDAALMAEHAAEVAESLGQSRLRTVFWEEACAGYRQWGARGKADALAAKLRSQAANVNTVSSSSGSEELELEALFRASIALSGELRLDHLAGEVVAAAIENAGATHGFLISERDSRLVVEVGRDAEGRAIVASGTPLADAPGVASSVVRYVARTGQHLVLADGAGDPRFASDPHLRDSAASILCAPLDHNGRRAGIVYLENRVIPGCFTPDRLRTVQVLAAQAAVAIQNAMLVDTLEAKVAERTHAIEVQHQQLIESHRALAVSEKMASLGQLVAGVAHELNTPLGAIGASVGNITVALDQSIRDMVDVVSEASPDELDQLRALLAESGGANLTMSSREERDTRGRLQSQLEATGVPDARTVARTLVSLGLTGALDPHLPLLRSPRAEALLRTAANVVSLRRNSGTIRTAVDRAAKIVFALKSYAHPGSAGGGLVEASLADNLNTVLTLYENQMKHGVELVRAFEDAGAVWGRHDELNQVWTNLIQNALQAMQYRGRLELRLARDGEWARVQVIDSGPGIPEGVASRIFDPFFTTKPQGEGSGLGLSISSEIIARHRGTLTVESRPGRTAFTVKLPLTKPAEAEPNG